MRHMIKLEGPKGDARATIFYEPKYQRFVAHIPGVGYSLKHDTLRGLRDLIRGAYQLGIESAKLAGLPVFWRSNKSMRDGSLNWDGEPRWWDGTLIKVQREGARAGGFKLLLKSPEHPYPFLVDEVEVHVGTGRKMAKGMNRLEMDRKVAKEMIATITKKHARFCESGIDALVKTLPQGDKQRRRKRGLR